MKKTIWESEIGFKELIIVLITFIFIVGAIIKKNSNSELVLNENTVWVDYKDTQVDLWMKNNEDVYGIQFEFNGINFISKEGGFLVDNKFEASHSEKIILAFSFQGKAIPPGEHMLLTLDVSYLNGKNNVTIKDMVIAGKGGKPLDFVFFNTILNKETFKTNQQ